MSRFDPFSDPPSSPLAAWVGERARKAQQRAAGLGFMALDHLLEQQSWARDRLREHAGKTLLIAIHPSAAPLPVLRGLPAPEWRSTITAEGRLVPAAAGAEPAASILITPSLQLLSQAFRDGPRAASSGLRIEGDPMLAAALGELAQHLRWDAEEDLSRVVGDVAAHRMMAVPRMAAAQWGALTQRLRERFPGRHV
jgi:ubiquinone biosynthesis protein UbiJ